MLLTRECDYAIRILRALSTGRLISVSGIAQAEDLTTQITYKLARKLELAGIIKSQRGVNGGYYLVRDLDELYLQDVFEAVDQKLLVTECMREGYCCSRDEQDVPCKVHKEFSRIQEILTRELNRKTLRAIIED